MIKKNPHRTNREIRTPNVRLVGDNIGDADIVTHDDEDVGFLRLRVCHGGRAEERRYRERGSERGTLFGGRLAREERRCEVDADGRQGDQLGGELRKQEHGGR